MDKVLVLENITKKFGPLTALDKLSFSIEKGNVYGILGPNGSGKSTTLGIILNVVNKTSGSYLWFGGNLDNRQALKKVGAIVERPNFYPYMSAYENLKLVCRIKGVCETAIEKVLGDVGLLERKNNLFSEFSMGMKQRLAIASALINNPEVLILDEPTNGLDPRGIHKIREIILLIAKKGTTILLASHLLDEIEKICTHVVVLVNGKKIYAGPVDEMTSSYGFFEMKTNQLESLLKFLETYPKIAYFKVEEKLVKAFPSEAITSEDLAKALYDNKLILTHFVKRKESLEAQFLQLTNDK